MDNTENVVVVSDVESVVMTGVVALTSGGSSSSCKILLKMNEDVTIRK